MPGSLRNPLTTILDHRLRVRLSDLPDGVAEYIMEALSIPNLAKQKALDQFVWGAESMPDQIKLYEIDGDGWSCHGASRRPTARACARW